MRVNIKKLDSRAVLPQAAHKGDVGFDLRALEGATIAAGERKLFATGLSMQPEPGWEVQIRPRSGLALKHGITVLNAPATIEPTYRGDVGVILHNTSNETYEVAAGDRIAQAVFKRYEPTIEFIEVDELEASERGEGGFGHTGS